MKEIAARVEPRPGSSQQRPRRTDLSCVAEVRCGLAISALTSSSAERIVAHERRLMATAWSAPVRTASPALLPPRRTGSTMTPKCPTVTG